jgi:hypothetical protein
MCDQARPEKALRPSDRSVNELVHHHEAAGRELFPQRSHGRNGDHVRAARLLQSKDIGASVNVARGQAVPAAVTGQKDETDVTDATGQKLIGRRTEGRIDGDPLSLFQRLDGV